MTTEQVKLKPCPNALCRSADVMVSIFDRGGEVEYVVGCCECGVAAQGAEYEDHAIQLWNHRPNPPSPDAGERREAIARILAEAEDEIIAAVEVLKPFDYGTVADAILALSPATDADTVMVPSIEQWLRENPFPKAPYGCEGWAKYLVPQANWYAAKAAFLRLIAASQVKSDPLPAIPEGMVARECPYNHPIGTRCPNCADWPYMKGGAAVFTASQSRRPLPSPQPGEVQ